MSRPVQVLPVLQRDRASALVAWGMAEHFDPGVSQRAAAQSDAAHGAVAGLLAAARSLEARGAFARSPGATPAHNRDLAAMRAALARFEAQPTEPMTKAQEAAEASIRG